MMKRVYNKRASSVLYNFIKSNNICGKVIIPSNICESVPSVYIKLGIEPVFCDISLVDWQVDKDKVMGILGENGADILHYNHTYGYISDSDDAFLQSVRSNYPNLYIVDDRCLCYPEFEVDNSYADLVLFSTGRVKCVDIGWGGYGFLSSRSLYKSYNLPFNPNDNHKFDDYVKLCHIDNKPFERSIIFSDWLDMNESEDIYFKTVESKIEEVLKHKSIINSVYKNLPGSFPSEYNNWRYQLLLDNQKECYEALFNEGLFCSYHYKSLGDGYFTDDKTPVNAYLERHVLNLFNDYHYNLDQAKLTANILNDIAVPSKRVYELIY